MLFPCLYSIHLFHKSPLFLVSYVFFLSLCKYKQVQIYSYFFCDESMLFIAHSSAPCIFINFGKFQVYTKIDTTPLTCHPASTITRSQPLCFISIPAHFASPMLFSVGICLRLVLCFIELSSKSPWAWSFVVVRFLMMNSIYLTF